MLTERVYAVVPGGSDPAYLLVEPIDASDKPFALEELDSGGHVTPAEPSYHATVAEAVERAESDHGRRRWWVVPPDAGDAGRYAADHYRDSQNRAEYKRER